MIAGFKRYLKARSCRGLHQTWSDDFQAELSAVRAANPEAVFIFQPGGMGVNFIKQWNQAGPRSGCRSLLGVFS